MVMPELRHLIAQWHRRHNKGDPCTIIFTDRVER
jgi:hypothetical protein